MYFPTIKDLVLTVSLLKLTGEHMPVSSRTQRVVDLETATLPQQKDSRDSIELSKMIGGKNGEILAAPSYLARALPLSPLSSLLGNCLSVLNNITAGIVDIDTLFFHVALGFLAICKMTDQNSM